MKRRVLLGVLAAVLGVGLVGSFSMAEDAPKKAYDKDSCCDKAAAKGEKCKHECCEAAEKEGKVCAKCNPESAKAEKK